MMNGDLVKEAVSGRPGTFLSRIQSSSAPLPEKLERLTMATLARKPTVRELAVFSQSLQAAPTRTASRAPGAAAEQAQETLRDACWAYLNSTEFLVNR